METIILENFYVVSCLVFHADNGVQDIAIIVRNLEVLLAKWHNTWTIHLGLILCNTPLQFLCSKCISLLFAFNVHKL